MDDYTFDVFVSYALPDREIAREISSLLRRVNFKPWLDEEQIVPGSRWRAALQQGLRDSKHLLVILTPAYLTRAWTQREIDVFDNALQNEERKFIALQIFPDLPEAPLDQVFQVTQRIQWHELVESNAWLWPLHCGLINLPPGPRSSWISRTKNLIETCFHEEILHSTSPLDYFVELRPFGKKHQDLLNILFDASYGQHFSLDYHYKHARPLANVNQQSALWLSHLLWAHGFIEAAALLSLVILPMHVLERSSWPFIDFNLSNIADSILLPGALTAPTNQEIWFSWGICTQNWSALPALAERSHIDIRPLMMKLATAAKSKAINFSTFEEAFDFGQMIAPWNHFHLSWIAQLLGDGRASLAHAEKLCTSSAFGENRTGRFLNRLLHWPIFVSVLDSIQNEMDAARRSLRLTSAAQSNKHRLLLQELWQSVTTRDISFRS